jgi:hypothetical protein
MAWNHSFHRHDLLFGKGFTYFGVRLSRQPWLSTLILGEDYILAFSIGLGNHAVMGR